MIEVYVLSLMLSACGLLLMLTGFRIHRIGAPGVLNVMFVFHVLGQLLPAWTLAADGTSAGEIFLLINSLAVLLIPIGGIFANTLTGGTSPSRFYTQPLDDDRAIRHPFWLFYICYATFCIALFVAYISQAPVIPVYQLLFGIGDVFSYLEARRTVNTSGLIFGIGQRFLLPLLFVLSIVGLSYFHGRQTRRIMWAGLVVPILYNSWAGAKDPVATLFVMAFMVMLIRYHEPSRALLRQTMSPRDRQRRRRRMVIGMTAAFLIAAGYPFFIYSQLPVASNGYMFILQAVFERILLKPAINSYSAVQMFEYGGFTYLADIKKLADLFGWEHIKLSTEVAHFGGMASMTNAPPAAIGNFYAQAGFLGVIIGVLFASFVFKLAENLIWTWSPKTPLSVALYAMLLYGAFRFTWANFHTLLATELIAPMLLMATAWTTYIRSVRLSEHRAGLHQ